MQPSNIDRFCHYMANTSDLIVVSANHRKAPKSRFPIPPIDIANVVRAIMDDTSADLYLADRSKVAVCGFSSGANLAMAVSQLPILRNDDGSHMLRGALGIYGNYDLRTTFKSKITGSGQPQENFERSLESRLDGISFLYVPDPADKKNALASPFSSRGRSCPKMCFWWAVRRMSSGQRRIACVRDFLGKVVKTELRLKRDGNKVVSAGVCYQKWGIVLTC
jgi:acetyl esterase/lipase